MRVQLEKQGLLEKVRVDKRFVYHPARDLNEAIKGLEP